MTTRAYNLVHIITLVLVLAVCGPANAQPEIPLPEHPRPDFQRAAWLNLNGSWEFRFDEKDEGLEQNWAEGQGSVEFPETITVPFSWGSKLSGIEDRADIGWYRRSIEVPKQWRGNRVFLVVGACDWLTTAWLDGNELGSYQGGYTPFEFDLTPYLKPGEEHVLVLRVDDRPHPFKLGGKQGYGRAAGIWQTVYLESRPEVALRTVHFTPDIHSQKVGVRAVLSTSAPKGMTFRLSSKSDDFPDFEHTVTEGRDTLEFDLPLPSPRLWSIDDPYLHEVEAVLDGPGTGTDRVSTYFGMREIGVVNLPGTDYPYVALNGKPVYLQLALDQAYHPEGYYTFPSDEFMRDEILRTRRIGLNGQRIHIKVEVPRKLYWADRLGVLIQADVPNSWGEPDADARRETETALRGMIARDYNHPSIFSWVNFNETWGLRTEGEGYTPETQEWVASTYRLTKELDPTRLVEDNSTNNQDHVVTDINSWHAYIPGYWWEDLLDLYCEHTYAGSPWNFAKGYKQARQPMMNSECGNVWGYEYEGGSTTGDIDWSWDYHMMINAFRRHPECCGWLYTEHHDVINEWNGYYRYDRSDKITGIPQLVPGMRLNDLHAPFYIAMEERLCRDVRPGEIVEVPLYASFFTDEAVGPELTLRTELFGWDTIGRRQTYSRSKTTVPYKPWMCRELEPLSVTMPAEPAVAVLALALEDASGNVLHRNFTTYRVANGQLPRFEKSDNQTIVRFAPDSFKNTQWSLKQWNILDGLKVNGAGTGFFEYHVPWPAGLKANDVAEASLVLELSAKRLNGKDVEGAKGIDGDFMLGKGTHDPGASPNSYPMTDNNTYPSAVRVLVAGEVIKSADLPDDPADHRGILSWHSQILKEELNEDEGVTFRRFKGGSLNEAGSYGYLVNARIPARILDNAQKEGVIRVRLEVDDALSGGLAIYGERFGRYPIDPTLVFTRGAN